MDLERLFPKSKVGSSNLPRPILQIQGIAVLITTTIDGEKLYSGDSFECAYCNAEVPAELYDVVPPVDDDAAWTELATAHSSNGCEWVETRAHTIPENNNSS